MGWCWSSVFFLICCKEKINQTFFLHETEILRALVLCTCNVFIFLLFRVKPNMLDMNKTYKIQNSVWKCENNLYLKINNTKQQNRTSSPKGCINISFQCWFLFRYNFISKCETILHSFKRCSSRSKWKVLDTYSVVSVICRLLLQYIVLYLTDSVTESWKFFYHIHSHVK